MGLSWSADGRFFAFADGATNDDVTRLWIVRTDDGQASAVTDGRTKVWSPRWSPDGSRLYFVSNRGGNMDLWSQRMGPDAEPEDSPQPVTVGIGIRHAVFSPDGTKLAYSRGREVANLWRVPILEDRRATWADAQQLTFDEAFIEFVDVSPDGERLLVSSDRSGNADLWMLPRDGGELMQVTREPTPDWYPRWAPDGQDIAFYSYRTGNREIWVMPVSGGPARQLTDGQATNTASRAPTWSPDGREIAFVRVGSGDASIYVMPRDGGKARQVTRRPESGWFPDWSPDGEWLVFGGQQRLWRVPAAGGNPELLTEGRRVSRWSRDGKRVYFAGRPGTTSQNLWAVSPEDRTVQAMTDLVGRQGRVSDTCVATDGQFLYFAWREDLGDIWVVDVVTDESE
jgi:TolB protein